MIALEQGITGNEESSPRKYSFDAVFVLCGGFHVTGADKEKTLSLKPRLHPSDLRDRNNHGILAAGLRNVAALEMYLTGQTKNIVFVGGVSQKNQDQFGHLFPNLPSEGVFYRDHMLGIIERMKNIQENKHRFVDLEEPNLQALGESKNTFGNWGEILNCARQNNWKKIAIVTNNYHTGRVNLQYQLKIPDDLKSGTHVSFIGAEKYIKKHIPGRYDRVIDQFYESTNNQAMMDRRKNERNGRRDLRTGLYDIAEQKGVVIYTYPQRLSTSQAEGQTLKLQIPKGKKVGPDSPLILNNIALEKVSSQIPKIIENMKAYAYGSNYASTEFGKLSLWYALSSAAILRPLLSNPTLLFNSAFGQTIGGEIDNPSMLIDKLAGSITEAILQKYGQPLVYYIEENKEWKHIDDPVNNRKIFVINDPLDGTLSASEGRRDQAAGIIIGDDKGAIAGCIVNLTDHEIILIERTSPTAQPVVQNLIFNETSNFLSRIIIPPRKGEVDLNDLKTATLSRRMADLVNVPLFQLYRNAYPKILSLGGYVTSNIIKGKLDTAFDPIKGRPLKEAAIWGYLGELAGLVVTYPDGRRINFPTLIKQSIAGQISMDSRIQLVSSANEALHQQILPLLRTTT